MKRYLLFSGAGQYPEGGMCDYVGAFDTVEDAQKGVVGVNDRQNWKQILDLKTGTVLLEHEPDWYDKNFYEAVGLNVISVEDYKP